MKQKLSVYCLWMATLSVLTFTALLHHHHAREICFVIETCATDGDWNDEHTHHFPSAGDDTPDDTCPVELAKVYLIAKNTLAQSAFSAPCIDLSLLASLPLMRGLPLQLSTRLRSFTRMEVPLYRAVFAASRGLRAPPTI